MPQPPNLEVVFVDNHLLVLAKPAGMPTVPDASLDESLFDLAKAWLKDEFQKPGKVFLGVIQRLDRPVSGVVCFARTSKAAARLTEAFGSQVAHKTYLAIGAGAREPGAATEGEVRQWLRKHRSKNYVTSFATEPHESEGAKLAITRWRVLGVREVQGRPYTLYEFQPVTGRSHQLRLAAKALGSPLLGDVKYARDLDALEDRSIALHAHRLTFEHPVKKEPVTFEVALPARSWWMGWEALG